VDATGSCLQVKEGREARQPRIVLILLVRNSVLFASRKWAKEHAAPLPLIQLRQSVTRVSELPL
jgi:hypothetical protein